MRYVAFVTKGLEQIVVAELQNFIKDVEIIEVGDKRVLFNSDQPPAILTSLRTVDDLCLFAAKVDPMQDLDSMLTASHGIDFDQLRTIIQGQRPLTDDFSITATMVGVEHFTAPELVDSLRQVLCRRYDWSYAEQDHSNFDVRLFIDRATAYIAVRLTAQSLMHRSYKKLSKPGSLRPTVAAAMVYAATGFRSGLSVVDHFCGSGTILCEAAALGNQVSGGDIDPQSVYITASNLRNVTGGAPQLAVLDATKTRWRDETFDCAISNLPWGKQVDLPSMSSLFDRTMKEYARIMKRVGVVCVLTPRPQPLIKYARKHMKGCDITLTPVSFTGQSPTIIVIQRA